LSFRQLSAGEFHLGVGLLNLRSLRRYFCFQPFILLVDAFNLLAHPFKLCLLQLRVILNLNLDCSWNRLLRNGLRIPCQLDPSLLVLFSDQHLEMLLRFIMFFSVSSLRQHSVLLLLCLNLPKQFFFLPLIRHTRQGELPEIGRVSLRQEHVLRGAPQEWFLRGCEMSGQFFKVRL
jgi:hypothetical protein